MNLGMGSFDDNLIECGLSAYLLIKRICAGMNCLHFVFSTIKHLHQHSQTSKLIYNVVVRPPGVMVFLHGCFGLASQPFSEVILAQHPHSTRLSPLRTLVRFVSFCTGGQVGHHLRAIFQPTRGSPFHMLT